MSDPEAVALLGDPKVRSAIGARAANRGDAQPVLTPRCAAVVEFGPPSFVVLVTNPAWRASWNDTALVRWRT